MRTLKKSLNPVYPEKIMFTGLSYIHTFVNPYFGPALARGVIVSTNLNLHYKYMRMLAYQFDKVYPSCVVL